MQQYESLAQQTDAEAESNAPVEEVTEVEVEEEEEVDEELSSHEMLMKKSPTYRESVKKERCSKGVIKMNRKQRRATAKMAKNSETKALADKMFQFDKLGDSCLVCDAPFDKKSKEMAMTWSVVVADEDTVNCTAQIVEQG